MKAVLIDVTKCTGCERCVQSCQESHALPREIPARKLSRDGLSSRRLTTVTALPKGGFAKKQCLHCLEPGCRDACPVGAIRKTDEGPVVYDRAKCMGCRYCMLSCPVGIPRYEWEQTLPYMQKCDLCSDRVLEGRPPACVEVCPNGALEFGEREALVRLAEARIRQAPGRYISHVYGKRELGGTCVLYVADQPLDALGWPGQVGDQTLATFTWPVISKTPWIAAGVASLLIGTYFITKRRAEVESAEREHNEAEPAPAASDDSDSAGAEP